MQLLRISGKCSCKGQARMGSRTPIATCVIGSESAENKNLWTKTERNRVLRKITQISKNKSIRKCILNHKHSHKWRQLSRQPTGIIISKGIPNPPTNTCRQLKVSITVSANQQQTLNHNKNQFLYTYPQQTI